MGKAFQEEMKNNNTKHIISVMLDLRANLYTWMYTYI